MSIIKKYNNLIIERIYEIKYNRFIDSNKFKYFNENNEISNFRINFIKKPRKIFKIEKNSFEFNDPKFSIQKSIIINLTNSSKEIQKKKLTYNPFLDFEDNLKITSPKYFSDDKKNLYSEDKNNIRININTQKREESMISSINQSIKNKNYNYNLFETYSSQQDTNNIKQNLELLKSLNIRSQNKDENEFLNSVNKSNILRITFHSNSKQVNNLPRGLDERGYLYNSDGTFFDTDGNYYNKEGFDKNKGRRNYLGDYIPGPDFNEEYGMYNKDINNLSFDKERLKMEIEDKDRIEFEKIKLEGKESKRLKRNYQYPIQKDDNIDENYIEEEFAKIDKSDNDEQLEDIIGNKTSSISKSSNIDSRFFNGEFNEGIENNLKSMEENENKNKQIMKNEEDEEIQNTPIKSKQKKQISKNKKKKNKKDNKKRKSRKSSPDSNIEEDKNENESTNKKEESKNKNAKKINTKLILQKLIGPEITEESINQEKSFLDIETKLKIKEIFKNYEYNDFELEDAFDDCVIAYLSFINNLNDKEETKK